MSLLIKLIPTAISIFKQIKNKPATGVKEITGLGTLGAIGLIISDYATCGSISCITIEHWAILATALSALLARLNAKRKED